MKWDLSFKLSKTLYIRDPEDTELGKKILKNSIILIDEVGFELFTFKKLAKLINTTEASIYRYFANKHCLLIYLVDWYWTWQEYRLIFHLNNMKSPEAKIKKAIQLLSTKVEDDITTSHINERLLYQIVMSEGAKSFFSNSAAEDTNAELFKPYNDLRERIAGFIKEYNPKYKCPYSLSSTIIEMAHSEKFYTNNLTDLTDFGSCKDDKKAALLLENLVFDNINQ